MNRKIECLKTNWTIVLIIAWIIVGFVLILIYLGIYGNVTWEVLTGFATWVLAAGVGFAIYQVRQARRSTNAQLAVELFRELRSEESKETLSLIYRLTPEDISYLYETPISMHQQYQDWKNRINSLLDKYVMLSNLVNNNIIEKSLAIETFGGLPALKCWYKLVDYIRKETCKRGYFLDNYEAFTRLCQDYFHDRHIEVNFYEERIDGTIKSKIPLITLFKLNPSLCPRRLEEIERDRKKKKEK